MYAESPVHRTEPTYPEQQFRGRCNQRPTITALFRYLPLADHLRFRHSCYPAASTNLAALLRNSTTASEIPRYRACGACGHMSVETARDPVLLESYMAACYSTPRTSPTSAAPRPMSKFRRRLASLPVDCTVSLRAQAPALDSGHLATGFRTVTG